MAKRNKTLDSCEINSKDVIAASVVLSSLVTGHNTTALGVEWRVDAVNVLYVEWGRGGGGLDQGPQSYCCSRPLFS